MALLGRSDYCRVRDGARLHFRALGQGKPVLMLHGLGMQGRDWLPFILPYARRYRFYLPDMRAAGRTTAAFNQADVFQNHMEDAEDLVAHLGLRDVLLVGYSLGATTSLHWHENGDFTPVKAYLHIDQSPAVINQPDWPHGLFGQQQTEFFARLRALLAALDQAPPQTQTLATLPPTLRGEVLAKLIDVLGSIAGVPWLSRGMRATPGFSGLWLRLLPMSRLADIRAYLYAYLNMARDYRASARDLAIPTTVLTGQQSPLYPAEGQAAFARDIGARQVVLEKSGHVPLFRQPLQFTRALGDFLERGSRSKQ